MEDSYQNIVRMCNYARQYHAEGILNTDWGDFGHINHPDFSVPGMIYGAAFSWNQENIAFDEINRQISRLEYGGITEQTVDILAKMPKHSLFTWRDAVAYYEQSTRNRKLRVEDQFLKLLLEDASTTDKMVKCADDALRELVLQMKRTAISMNTQTKEIVGLYELAAKAIQLWNETRLALVHEKQEHSWNKTEAFALAGRLKR